MRKEQITREQLEALPHAAYGTLAGWTGHYVPVHEVLVLLGDPAGSAGRCEDCEKEYPCGAHRG